MKLSYRHWNWQFGWGAYGHGFGGTSFIAAAHVKRINMNFAFTADWTSFLLGADYHSTSADWHLNIHFFPFLSLSVSHRFKPW